MEGRACAYGAATIANAIATGKGAAFGISLKTCATVRLNRTGRFSGMIKGFADEDTLLIELCAKKVLDYSGLTDYGAVIETISDIPIASGLKSSSATANAVVLAAYAAVRDVRKDLRLTDKQVLDLAVDAALEAKVTVTGAYDDAAASYYGGYVVTDNVKRRIVRKGSMDKDLKVVLYIPKEKNYTCEVDVGRLKLVSGPALLAWKEAVRGEHYTALTANGLIYSAVLSCDTRIPLAALEAGAVAAGISGKGPAVVALTKEDPKRIISAWRKFPGSIIQADINNKKAKIVE